MKKEFTEGDILVSNKPIQITALLLVGFDGDEFPIGQKFEFVKQSKRFSGIFVKVLNELGEWMPNGGRSDGLYLLGDHLLSSLTLEERALDWDELRAMSTIDADKYQHDDRWAYLVIAKDLGLKAITENQEISEKEKAEILPKIKSTVDLAEYLASKVSVENAKHIAEIYQIIDKARQDTTKKEQPKDERHTIPWSTVHQTKNLSSLDLDLDIEQKALIIIARNVDMYHFILQAENFDRTATLRASLKIDTPSQFAEYIEKHMPKDKILETAVSMIEYSKQKDT